MPAHERRYEGLLEELLQIDVRDPHEALNDVSTRIAERIGAEKVDTFLREGQMLVARGTSRTPLGERQHQMGLDRVPIAAGGRAAWVYETGQDHLDGDIERDPLELEAVKRMGARSTIATPLVVGTERRGVLQAVSTRIDAFQDADLQLLRAVSRWVGVLTHRAELQDLATRTAIEQGRRLAAEELVTVLAHDLGNYLTPLRGRLELNLRDARRDGRETPARRLDAAIATVDQIMQLIADLLDVSRIEEGMLRIERSLIQVRSLAAAVAKTLSTDRVRVRVDVPEDLHVRADLRRLRQVLTNLVDNSVKHSPRGSTVVVRGRRVHAALEISVIDEGPGVPNDLMPHVFTRYARGPRSTGLGIGLYLAERIANAHGGSLTLESTSAGATFTLRIPDRYAGDEAAT